MRHLLIFLPRMARLVFAGVKDHRHGMLPFLPSPLHPAKNRFVFRVRLTASKPKTFGTVFGFTTHCGHGLDKLPKDSNNVLDPCTAATRPTPRSNTYLTTRINKISTLAYKTSSGAVDNFSGTGTLRVKDGRGGGYRLSTVLGLGDEK